MITFLTPAVLSRYGFTTVGPADLGNFVPAAPVGSSTCPE